jgi:hypothetical protein
VNHKNEGRLGIAIERKIEASSYLHRELSSPRSAALRTNAWLER